MEDKSRAQGLLKSFHDVDEAQLQAVAKSVINEFSAYHVYLLKGNLGAGKTTFVKAACAALGSIDEVSSPTYSIANEYHTVEGKRIFHLDMYRLNDETEAANAGVEDYFYNGDYCFVEWFERAPNLLPQNCLLIEMEGEGNSRKISIFGFS